MLCQEILECSPCADDGDIFPCANTPSKALEFCDLDLRTFKVEACPRTTKNHDTTTCPYYHHQHDRRRPLTQFMYEPDQCEQHFLDENSDVATGRACPNGDRCGKCHTVVELLYHPSVYKRRFCLHMGRAADRCPRGSFCAFAHSRCEIADPASIYTEQEEHAPTDDFFLYKFKTQWCPLSGPHDWNTCIYAHTKKDLRRTPNAGYAPRMCPTWEKALKGDGSGARKAYDACCPDGIDCRGAHGLKELLYHPQQYKTRICTDPTCNGQRRKVCAFAHHESELRRPQKIRGAPCARSVIENEQPYFWSPLVFATARARQLDECVRAPTCAIRTPSPEPYGYEMQETTPVRELPNITLVPPPGSVVAQPVPGFAAIPVLFSPPKSSQNSPQIMQCLTPPSPTTPNDESSPGPNRFLQNHNLWVPNGMTFVPSEPNTPARVVRSPPCGMPLQVPSVRNVDSPSTAGMVSPGQGRHPFAVTLPLTLLVSQASYTGKLGNSSADTRLAENPQTGSHPQTPDSAWSESPSTISHQPQGHPKPSGYNNYSNPSVQDHGAGYSNGYYAPSPKSGRRRHKKKAADFNSNHSDPPCEIDRHQQKSVDDSPSQQIASPEPPKPSRRHRGPRGRGAAAKTGNHETAERSNSAEILELKRQLNSLLQENRQLREGSTK